MNNTNIVPEPFMIVEQQLLNQMKQYLDREITREEYADIAESYYSENASTIENSNFSNAFLRSIPDACLIYIDEPGGIEEGKEEAFYSIVSQTYDELYEIRNPRNLHDFFFVYEYDREKKTAMRMYQLKNGLMYRYDPKRDLWDIDGEQYCIFVGEDVLYDEITEEEAREVTVRV